MSILASDCYVRLVKKADWSHKHGLNVFRILQTDIDNARLFCYGYRAQTIGTFHATRVALENQRQQITGRYATACLRNAEALLRQLQTKAIDNVPADFRALVSTFYEYHEWTNHVARELAKACTHASSRHLDVIRQRFLRSIELVRNSSGIYVCRDVILPQQGVYVVPTLGISIVPFIYGDNHSWNAAFLSSNQVGVPLHRHRKGAEIHLGFSPLKGRTVLGNSFAEVQEAYAMPIAPGTDHGFLNTSGHDHILPFIFGSLVLSGWGIFDDVEPRSCTKSLKEREIESSAMNHAVLLERAIRRITNSRINQRQVLISAERTGSPEIGGLELAVTHISQGQFELTPKSYKIVSIRSGQGRVRIGNSETEVRKHDHFGIPAGMNSNITYLGKSPLVMLDATITPVNGMARHK